MKLSTKIIISSLSLLVITSCESPVEEKRFCDGWAYVPVSNVEICTNRGLDSYIVTDVIGCQGNITDFPPKWNAVRTDLCQENATCINNKCVVDCSANEKPCHGQCANLESDKNNCGSCGNVCDTNAIKNSSDVICANHTCIPTSCLDGYAICDRACVDPSLCYLESFNFNVQVYKPNTNVFVGSSLKKNSKIANSLDPALLEKLNQYKNNDMTVMCDKGVFMDKLSSCKFDNPGNYTIKIHGSIDHLTLCLDSSGVETNNSEYHIKSIDQWGTSQWKALTAMFFGCDDLKINATDIPDFRQVQDASYMFTSTKSIQLQRNMWDDATSISFSHMFEGAESIDYNIQDWRTSKVTDMSFMFSNAIDFNQPIGNWDVSNVTNMSYMFYNADAFDQPIGDWDVSNVTNMSYMFYSANDFNQPLYWNTNNVSIMTNIFHNSAQTCDNLINFDFIQHDIDCF